MVALEELMIKRSEVEEEITNHQLYSYMKEANGDPNYKPRFIP